MSATGGDGLGQRLLIGSGAVGTLLRSEGESAPRPVEFLNLSAPEKVRSMHRAYRQAGADVLVSNTFAANPIALEEFGAAPSCEEINRRGVELAREAAGSTGRVWASVGPLSLGLRLEDFPPEDLVQAYIRQCAALAGADALLLETFVIPREAEAALKAATAAAVPVIFQIGNTGRGTSGRQTTEVLLQLALQAGVCAVGTNCRHPDDIVETVGLLLRRTALPVTASPNAGNPSLDRGLVTYNYPPGDFLRLACTLHDMGVALIGGCCGTTPEHIRLLAREMAGQAVRRPAVTKAAPSGVERPREPQPGAPSNPVRQAIESDRTVISVEIRADRGDDLTGICAGALDVVAAGADLLDVPDKPGATVGRDAAVVAARLQEVTGRPAIAHRTAIHCNLLEAHTHLIGAWDLGLRGLLALTGDPPSIGPLGAVTSRVMDVRSSVELLRLVRTLRSGATVTGDPIRDPPDFCAGCAIGRPDPSHIEWLRRKVDAGSEFVFSQPVFDFDEFRRLQDSVGPLGLRLFPGILPIVSARNALFLAGGNVPGIRVPDALVAGFARFECAADQRKFGLDQATDLACRVVPAARALYLIMPFGRRCYADSAALVRAVRSAPRDPAEPPLPSSPSKRMREPSAGDA
jgi:homocysteine S-methyltransferase